jgi:hypothetical protein
VRGEMISNEMNIVGAGMSVRPCCFGKSEFIICQDFGANKHFDEINFGVSMIFL